MSLPYSMRRMKLGALGEKGERHKKEPILPLAKFRSKEKLLILNLLPKEHGMVKNILRYCPFNFILLVKLFTMHQTSKMRFS